MTAITDGKPIPNRRYKPQFGNDEVSFKWLQANITMSDNQRNTPGTKDAAPMTAAVITPAITRVVIGDDFDSDMRRESPTLALPGMQPVPRSGSLLLRVRADQHVSFRAFQCSLVTESW